MRANRLWPGLSARWVFLTGIVTLPAFAFQPLLAIRVGQVLVFAGMAALAGKRIRVGYFVLMVATIVVFHLLTPVGRVVATVGPFALTTGALENGLRRGVTIVGFVFLSLLSVRRDLSLPGRFGGMVTRTLYYYQRLFDERRRIRRSTFLADVDALLEDLLPVDAVAEGAAGPHSRVWATSPVGEADERGAEGDGSNESSETPLPAPEPTIEPAAGCDGDRNRGLGVQSGAVWAALFALANWVVLLVGLVAGR